MNCIIIDIQILLDFSALKTETKCFSELISSTWCHHPQEQRCHSKTQITRTIKLCRADHWTGQASLFGTSQSDLF
jgi:hypothetical protein